MRYGLLRPGPCGHAEPGSAENPGQPATACRRTARIRSSVFLIPRRLIGRLLAEQSSQALLLIGGKVTRARGFLAPTTQYPHSKQDETTEQKPGRAVPEQQGTGRERRLVEDEIAVTRHQEIDDLLVALAFFQHAIDLRTQVHGNRRIRVGDVLVLALGATQLLDQAAITLALRLVGELVGVDGRLGAQRQGQAQQARRQQSFHRPASSISSRYSGASC